MGVFNIPGLLRMEYPGNNDDFSKLMELDWLPKLVASDCSDEELLMQIDMRKPVEKPEWDSGDMGIDLVMEWMYAQSLEGVSGLLARLTARQSGRHGIFMSQLEPDMNSIKRRLNLAFERLGWSNGENGEGTSEEL